MKWLATILLSLFAFGTFGQINLSKFNQRTKKGLDFDSIHNKLDSLDFSSIASKDSVQKSKRILANRSSANRDRLFSYKKRLELRIDSSATGGRDTINRRLFGNIKGKYDSIGNSARNTINVSGVTGQLGEMSEAVIDVSARIKSPFDSALSQVNQNVTPSLQPSGPPLQNFSLPELDPVSFAGEIPLSTSGLDKKPNGDFVSLNNLDNVDTALDPSKNFGSSGVKLPSGLPGDDVLKTPDFQVDNLEDKIPNIAPVEQISSQLSEADRAKRFFDPQVAKEEAVNKAKLEAVNHFSGHEQEIMAAIQLLSDAKSKVPGTDQIVNPFSGSSHSFKDIPTIQRFVPSFTMQIQRSQSLWFDLNPAIGFRLSGRITAGAGWNYRVAYFANEKRLDQSAGGYGVRTYLHFRINSLLSLKTDIEGMNVEPRQFGRVNSELTQRTWAWGFFLGAKKDFSLGKRMTGNVQMLYNLLRTNDLCPYVHKFNVRMGIDLPLYKKKNQIDSENKTKSK